VELSKREIKKLEKTNSLLHDKIYKHIESFNSDLIHNMEEAQQLLCDISELKFQGYNAKINSNYNFEYNCFLWQMELLGKFYLCVSMLGYIDAMINYCDREIRHHINFAEISEDEDLYVEKIRNFKAKLLVDREEVVSGYKSISVIKKEADTSYDSNVETCPSYKTFTDLFSDTEENDYQLNLQQQFISAYISGNTSTNGKYSEKLEKYRELFSSMTDYVSERKKAYTSLEKVKVYGQCAITE